MQTPLDKMRALKNVLDRNLGVPSTQILPIINEIIADMEEEVKQHGVTRTIPNANKPEVDQANYDKAREYLKAKKVNGYGLLKGNNMIVVAIKNGFIV